MGGVVSTLFGGSSAKQSSQSNATQGFAALPPEIQQVFTTLANQAGNYLQGGSQAGQTSGMYTPIPQTSGETTALNTINQGFNPTQSQFNSSVNEQMNPYNQDVIDLINKNAYGQNSQLAGTLAQAGQFGSNRMALGANDIANTQAATIGSILNPEYNNAVNNALQTIPGLNAASAQAQLSGGQFQRNLGLQTSQSPITGLGAIAQILGILPTNSGVSNSTSNGQSNSNNGIFQSIPLFSDQRLKENIVPAGSKNGYPVYWFNYKGAKTRYMGVMAQDVMRINPEAVSKKDGYHRVDYGRLRVAA